jgi:hypothetical protein
MFDFPTTPAVGTIVQVPDGSWRRWDGVKWGPTPGPGPETLQVFIGDAPPGPPGGPLHGELWFNSYEQQMYIWYDDPNSSQWVIVTANVGGISADAPHDGQIYGRQDGGWVGVGEGVGGPFLPLTGTTPITGPITGIVDIINNPADPFINTSPFETHRLMVQVGPHSPLDIALMGGGTGGPGVAGYFNGFSSAISVPFDAITPSGAQAIAGFAYSQCPFVPGSQSGPAATALYGMAVADGSNVHVWGGNVVINDGPSYAPDGSINQVLNGIEFDVNMYNGGYADATQNTAIQVQTIHLNTRYPPRPGSLGYSISCASYFNPISYAFASLQGAATNALYVGPTTFFPLTWAANHAYVLNHTVQPTPANGYAYVCTVAGTSGSVQPTFPTSAGTVTDGGVTWAWQRTLGDTSQAILWNFVDGTATPTQRQMRMQVLPSPGGGNLNISGVPGIVGLNVTGAVQSYGISEILSSFVVPAVPPNGNPNNPAVWAPITAYAINAQTMPIVVNGSKYICTVAGTSGATPPAWPGSGTVTDGSVTWSFNGAIASGNNNTSFQSATGVMSVGLAIGAVQLIATAGTNTNGMNSQRINYNFSLTGSAALQSYQMVVVPTASGGTMQMNASGVDANVFVKTGLQVGSPTGGMGAVGTVKASGAGTFNGGFGVFTTTTPVTTKPTLTGAWAGNTAGKALSTLLATYGLLIDSTTA